MGHTRKALGPGVGLQLDGLETEGTDGFTPKSELIAFVESKAFSGWESKRPIWGLIQGWKQGEGAALI